MQKLVLMLFMLFAINNFGQDLVMETDDVIPADLMPPKYKNGGISNFYKYVNGVFNMKTLSKEGQILVSVTINATGELNNIRIVKSPNPEAALEMIAVLQKSEKWEPATRGGVPTSISLKLPFGYKTKTEQKEIVRKEPIDDSYSALPSSVALDVLETKPSFPGGIQAFYKYIGENYYPPTNSKGRIQISMVVEKDGSLTDFKIIKDIGNNAADKLIEVLKKCPRFKPGMQNGRAVRVQYNLPVTISPTP